MTTFTPHSTRLFPKGQGANQYKLTGVAARCDWVVLSDVVAPRVHLLKERSCAPKTVFLSLRAPFDAIEFFANTVLPEIESPFVLISGSEDITVPLQTDLRWRAFNDIEAQLIRRILDNEWLVAWFAENLDCKIHSKLRPLPLGMVYPGGARSLEVVPEVSRLRERPPRALLGHRVRPGDQWASRKRVSAMAQRHWSSFCSILTKEVSEPEYLRLMSEHAFVICVEGGGYDPSPKAWQALIHGAVPIILDTPAAGAYCDLPVIRVPRWTPEVISAGTLKAWQKEMTAQLDTEADRQDLIEKLSEKYWWDKICKAMSEVETH